jgi:hypothetical protein
MNKNVGRSKKLKKAIHAKARECWTNAWVAIATQDEYENATYVEGAVIAFGDVVEHGWIEHEGEIIDPTLLDANITYFPGLRFKGRTGLDSTWHIPGYMESGVQLPVYLRLGHCGVDSPQFLKAVVDAFRFAGMDELADCCLEIARSNARQPPS